MVSSQQQKCGGVGGGGRGPFKNTNREMRRKKTVAAFLDLTLKLPSENTTTGDLYMYLLIIGYGGEQICLKVQCQEIFELQFSSSFNLFLHNQKDLARYYQIEFLNFRKGEKQKNNLLSAVELDYWGPICHFNF